MRAVTTMTDALPSPRLTGRLRARRGAIVLAAVTLLGTACAGSDSGSSGATTVASTVIPTDSSPVDEGASGSTEPVETAPIATDTPLATEVPDASQPDGYEFTSPDGTYTIVLPGEPTSMPIPVELPTGPVVAEAFISEDASGAAYFTSVFEYPEGTTDADPEVVLTGARDGAVSNVDGVLVDSEFVEVDGVPGVSFSFTVSGGDGKALILFDEPRLYQSFALGTADQSGAFGAFLDSFAFTDAATSTSAGGDS